jgi:hypothetical protein
MAIEGIIIIPGIAAVVEAANSRVPLRTITYLILQSQ